MLFSSYFLALMSIIFAKLVFQCFKKKKTTAPPLPPGPPRWPILGCAAEIIVWGPRHGPAYKWFHRVMEELGREIVCIRLGGSHNIVVSSPELAREFLRKHDAVFSSRPVTMATRIVSYGFNNTGMVPRGEQWRKMRRVLVSQVLNNSTVQWLLHKRNQEADNLIRFLYHQCNTSQGEVINVRIIAQHYSASVMRRMMFNIRHFGNGRDDGGPSLEDEEHVSALFALLSHIYAFSISDYFPWLEWLDLDGHRKRVCDAMKVINKYQDPIVCERIRQWREFGGSKKTQPEDLLDVFISLKDLNGNQLLSDDEVRAQVAEILFASVDNPCNVAEWALSEMLNKPEILEKAVKELDGVIGKDRLIQEADIPRLPYLMACAREALRLHPVSPFNLPHTSTQDCIVAGYFIPKGSSVLLSRLGLGRNPRVWDNPLSFDPERHMSENGQQYCSNYLDLTETELRFISFSAGRRGCVAARLGSIITMMLLGRLIQGFAWNIPKGLDKIDLSEAATTLFKATPLCAHAKPRLSPLVYASLQL